MKIDELNSLPMGGGFTESDLEGEFNLTPFKGGIEATRKAIEDIKQATLALEKQGLDIPAVSRAAMKACILGLKELEPEEMPELDDEDIIRIADL